MPRDDRAALAAGFQEEINRPPEAPGIRNINHDVHLGYAPQVPYAALEDRMGAAVRPGYGSFEELQVALKGVEGEGNQIEQDATGDWVRYVPRTVEVIESRDGTREALVEDVARYVALTRNDARARSAGGAETDYFDGFTWWRRGVKPEKDMFVAAQQLGRRNLRRVSLDPAPATPASSRAGAASVDTSGRPAARKE